MSVSLVVLVLVSALFAPASAQLCNCTTLWYNTSSTCAGTGHKLNFAVNTQTCFSDSTAIAPSFGLSGIAFFMNSCSGTFAGNYYINGDCTTSAVPFSYTTGACTSGTFALNSSTTEAYSVKVNCTYSGASSRAAPWLSLAGCVALCLAAAVLH